MPNGKMYIAKIQRKAMEFTDFDGTPYSAVIITVGEPHQPVRFDVEWDEKRNEVRIGLKLKHGGTLHMFSVNDMKLIRHLLNTAIEQADSLREEN